MDRHGGAALLLFAGGYTLGLLLLVLGSVEHWRSEFLVLASLLAGMSVPPVIAVARARWPHVAGSDLARAGHAMNALLGEIGAVLGPAVTGGLAALVGPAAALASLLVSMGLPRHLPQPGTRAGGPLRASPGLRTLVISGLPLGLALGALTVAAPALAARHGAAELAALPLASFAAGSALGSLWAGQSTRAGGPARRYVAGFVGLAAVLPACLVAGSVVALAVVLLFAGVGYALVNVGLFELLDEVVPARNAVEALTWLTSAEGVGFAIGGALAGSLAATSLQAGFVVVAIAPGLGAAVAVRRRWTLQVSAVSD